jgi:hypothetical protein
VAATGHAAAATPVVAGPTQQQTQGSAREAHYGRCAGMAAEGVPMIGDIGSSTGSGEGIGSHSGTLYSEVLAALRLEHRLGALAAQHIVTVDDLRRLCRADCRELGVKYLRSLLPHATHRALQQYLHPFAAFIQLLGRLSAVRAGMTIGESNRLLSWSGRWADGDTGRGRGGEEVAAAAAVAGADGERLLMQLSRCVDTLEEEVLARAGWVEASLEDIVARKHAAATAAMAASQRGARVAVRTRVGPAQVKKKTATAVRRKRRRKAKAKAQAKAAVLTNALFANAGSARRIGFAIDISGSMGAGTPMGANRLEVVKQHLRTAIAAMEGAFGAAFNIVLFDQECHTPMGTALVPATWAGVKVAENVIEQMQPGGGNGGEAACMLALLRMVRMHNARHTHSAATKLSAHIMVRH